MKVIKKQQYDAAQERAKRLHRKAVDPVMLRLRQMWSSARLRARKQNVPFNIDVEYLKGLAELHCPILGYEMDYVAPKIQPNSPTLDKFIPALGYVRGNVTIMSHRANCIKRDASAEEILKLLLWMHQKYNEDAAFAALIKPTA